MSKTVDKAVKAILSTLEDETDPDAGVSRKDYLEILEEVASDIETRIDAVQAELEEEGEDDGDGD